MKSTVISLLPYVYDPQFPGVLPPFFHIPALDIEDLKRGDFNILHVDDAMGYENNQSGNKIKLIYLGEQVAGSIANDHINSSMYSTPTAFPGIKGLPGMHEKADIKKNFPELLSALDSAQRAWFSILVRVADDTWKSPGGQNAGNISDIQRTAAKVVAPDKPWLNDVRVDLNPCPACTIQISSSALICPHCKTIVNQEAYDLRFKKAESVGVSK